MRRIPNHLLLQSLVGTSLFLLLLGLPVVVEAVVHTENQYSVPHGIAIFKTLDEANQIHHDGAGNVKVQSAASAAMASEEDNNQFVIRQCLDEDHGTKRKTCGHKEACVSFEAKNQPNHYLKHEGWTIKLVEGNLSSKTYQQDASYCVRKANTQRVPGRVSFESVNFPGRYITYVAGHGDSLQLKEVSDNHNDIPSTWHVEYVPSEDTDTDCGLLELYTPDNYPIYVEEGDDYSEMTWKAKVDGLPNGEDSKLQTRFDTFYIEKDCLAGSGEAIKCSSAFKCVSYQSVRFPNLFLMQSPDKSKLIFSDPNIEYKGLHRSSFCENEPLPGVYQYAINSAIFIKRFNYDLIMGSGQAATFSKKYLSCDLLPNKGGDLFTDKETKYEFVTWENLPFKVELAAKALKFTSSKWNHKQWPFDETTLWKDLSPIQVSAAETLGWTAKSWDDEYKESDFDSLPALQKRAAAVVGLNANNWNDWPTSLKDKFWDDLTLQEQKTFAVFGWHKTVWDSHTASGERLRQRQRGLLVEGGESGGRLRRRRLQEGEVLYL